MDTTQKEAKSKWKFSLNIRKEIPDELEKEFTAFKDIKSIDRIQASAWLGFALTIFMFGLDIYRQRTGEFYTSHWYTVLFYFHLLGLLFLFPAVYTTVYKKWIIQTRLRRGIVIWGMVVLTITFMLGQSVVIYFHREGLVMFLGFIFIFTWMFAMSHTERTIFAFFSLTIMCAAIILNPNTETSENTRVTNFIEVLFLSTVAFIFDSFDFNLKLANFMNQLKIKDEQERIIRLEEFKSRFFTNLTHELRTPLTMISGMAREIAEDPRRWATEGSEIIVRNSGNLLNLVNQILALSKIESGSLPLYMVKGDVVSYLGYVVDAFRGHALAKRIKLHFLSEEAEVIMDYDPDKYMTILSNLLSNAIKFTPEEGNVYVSLVFRQAQENSYFEMTVRDTGIGIPQSELDHIFERFYQAQNELTGSGVGTGIGLSLVYELIKLLGGDIQVKSVLGKGTTFTVTLPRRAGEMSDGSPLLKEDIRSNVNFYLPPSRQEEIPVEEIIDEKPDILIIEDNTDVIKYLHICLGDIYRITSCTDGLAGLEKAIEMVPDLILSDVLMPVKDGLAVCRELKKHPITNHIPIILLSAKVDPESRLAGLQSGADVYMAKPFDKHELRMQIHNLLDRRQVLHARYLEETKVSELSSGDPPQQEDPFVVKARNIVFDHLDESEFSVLHLYRAVFLSRTQLHKKLKALTGMSATHFIRHIRLTKAREFLKSGDMNITEIAYQVGFSDPNYFTRCYGEEFGESPSETRNNKKIS